MTLSADKRNEYGIELGEILMYFYLAYTRHISTDYHKIGENYMAQLLNWVFFLFKCQIIKCST